jgi:NhaA family Na+:H+ antiporter
MTPSHPDASATLVVDRISHTLHRFLHVEAISGVVLLAAACVALFCANSVWSEQFDHLWHIPITFGIGEWSFSRTLHFWINDGLMTIFFLVVGLEIRRELHEGALSSLRLALLPIVAALGGVAVPAIIYLALAPGASQGWAVPTATDIAFAVGVLALLGRRIPSAVRVFLLAIAIIDDIAAILIIALFYSSGIAPAGLLIVALALITVFVWQRIGIRTAWAYVPPGLLLWCGLLIAGLHPTLAGVMLGLITPVRIIGNRDHAVHRARSALKEFDPNAAGHNAQSHVLMEPLQDLQRAQLQMLAPVVRVQALLHPWVAYGIMPLFALANAGVTLPDVPFSQLVQQPVVIAVLVGLVAGKPMGIILASLLATRIGFGELPSGVNWRGLLVVGCLGGIGFTMSIFIGDLAFESAAMLGSAKLGILIASATAAVVGLIVGRLAFPTESART